jgi:hypothetical protein
MIKESFIFLNVLDALVEIQQQVRKMIFLSAKQYIFRQALYITKRLRKRRDAKKAAENNENK